MERTTNYPYHLAQLVAGHLSAKHGQAPPETALTQLLEVLYFASLKTDEGRPIRCTVNYASPVQARVAPPLDRAADAHSFTRFDTPLPYDVRTLTKLAKAVDPAVGSLAVFHDDNELYIWAVVDQEVRYSEFITVDGTKAPERPGLLQATIAGVGNISVYDNYALIGSLEHNALVEEYHDVLWNGPVHEILQAHLRQYIEQHSRSMLGASDSDVRQLEQRLQVPWFNAICRILMNIQNYRCGGGLLIVPHDSFDGLNVKYRIHYDRLPRAQIRRMQKFVQCRNAARVVDQLRVRPEGWLPSSLHDQISADRAKLEEHKKEVLGCVRFIASLACVDGFVLFDRGMTVRGFGVEVRSDNQLSHVFTAGDSQAAPRHLRQAELSQFGTRHRAMMRYCYSHPGALGFVISQDGDIRAMVKIGDKLVLWENVEIALAFRAEDGTAYVGLPIAPAGWLGQQRA